MCCLRSRSEFSEGIERRVSELTGEGGRINRYFDYLVVLDFIFSHNLPLSIVAGY